MTDSENLHDCAHEHCDQEHAHECHHDHGHAHDHRHDHDHHHEHDHAHSHDHHHAHGKETVLVDDGSTYLSVMDHEGSLVASYRFALDATLDEAQERVSTFASAVARAVDDQGGIVGHVKAVVREAGQGVRVSVTFDEPDITPLPAAGVRVEGVAIVLAVDRSWYETLLVGLLKQCRGNS